MAVHSSFDGSKFKNITGYKICCCFQEANGIQDSFYIYIEQVISPQNDFDPVKMDSPSPQGGNKRGTLTLFDDKGDINYQFNNIDLVDYQVHFSHFKKVRMMKFRYDPQITNEGRFCTLSNNRKSKQSTEFNNKFAQDYLYSIQGKGMSESLLSLSTKFVRNGKEHIMFGTQRTKDNSFMELTMDLDRERINGGIQSKTITYKGLLATINQENLDAILVDETYGSFLKYGIPNLDRIAGTINYPELLPIEYNPLTPLKYLQHSEAPPVVIGIIDNAFATSIETAVLILRNGICLDHSGSLV